VDETVVRATAPAGWYPVADDGYRYWDGRQWSPVAPVPWAPPLASPGELAANRTATGIGTLQLLSGLAWIFVGFILFFSITNPLLGLVGMILGTLRLSIVGQLNRRSKPVLAIFEGKTGLIIIGTLNVLALAQGLSNAGFDALLAAAGLIVLALDIYIRDRVLENREIFDR
jgi:hypothetical protein